MTTDLAHTAAETDDSLSLLPPAQPMHASSVSMLMDHAKAMGAAYDLAEKMCGTQLVPSIYRGKPEDGTAAILYGAELGLTPIQSLQQIFVVHGTPAIYARTMVALLKRRGYRIWTESSTDESVTVMGQAPDGTAEASTWTIERATKAGYVPTIDEKTGKFKTNSKGNLIGNEKYLTDPQAMLYAKAAAEVCRKLAPEVLLGISVDDEPAEEEASTPRKVRNEVQAPGVEELRARMGIAAAPKASSDLAAKPETQQADDTQAGTPEPEVKKPTAAQNRALNALYERAGLAKENREGRRIVFASFFPDRELGAQPSADETAHVIAQLEQLADSGEDDSVLVAFAEDVITQHAQTAQEG
ncbi:hypothetical protein [Gordonia sputi]